MWVGALEKMVREGSSELKLERLGVNNGKPGGKAFQV